MNSIFKKLIYLAILLIMSGSFAGMALAVNNVTPLTVNFSATPLFNEANFAPGNAVIRTVLVANNSGTSQNVIVEAINALDENGLGDKLNLVIKEGDTILYNDKLGTFLRAGEVPLSSLSDGANTTYSFNVVFDSNTDNNIQNKTLGFDLCVGFSGGDKNCGNTVIGDENNTGGGNDNPPNNENISGTSGGGGGGGAPIILVISNEQVNNTLNEGETATVTIKWDTNKLSTSQVVYGLVSDGPYTLVMVPPYFGYPLATTEDPTKVMHHSVLLTGLIPGQTYIYRVVSHASPPTIGFEHQFTVPVSPTTHLLAQTNITNPITTTNEGINVLNTNNPNTENNSAPKTENNNTVNSNSNLTANALFSDFGNIISNNILIFILILLLVLYLIWRFWLRKKTKRKL